MSWRSCLITIILFWPVVTQADVTITPVDITAIAQQVLAHTTVTAQRGTTVLNDRSSDGALLIKTSRPIGLESQPNSNDLTVIRFTGTEAPVAATIQVTVPDQNITRTMIVDEFGNWTIDIPTKLFGRGQHAAYLQVVHATNVSSTNLIAQFTVQHQDALTQSSWIFLFTTAVTMVCLLLAITLQLRHNLLKPAIL